MTERATFLVDHADAPALREAVAQLAGIGYTENLVRERLGLEDLADLQWRAVPMCRAERLAGRDPLALAIDLFLLQGALPENELNRLFAAPEREALILAGLLAIDKNIDKNEGETGLARARASLFPVGDRLIFSDHAWPELPHPGYDTVPCDHVMAVGCDSRRLARCTTRRKFRAALDLCTGSGIHALLASSHAERVLAVDINPRAARCARFNAQAAGASNVEVVDGDLFEAVRGERFDLITANPPFVSSPVDSVRFRDGGRSGEDIQKRIVAGLPQHLAPGGMAQMVTELGEREIDRKDDRKVEREVEPLVHRLRAWLKGAAMDIHILRLGEHSAAQYAIGHAKGDTYQGFMDSTGEWASNLRTQGYLRVVSVVISFQWSDAACGPPWERVDESPSPQRAAGAEIDAAFSAERLARRVDGVQTLRQKWLRRAGPVALLDARVLGSDLRAKTKATLLGQALRIEHQLDPVERGILDRMNGYGAGNGRISVADLVADLAGTFRDLDVDEPRVMAATRSLLGRQLLRMDE
jgi:methylase of polypeptide subunit release factors